MRRVLPLCLLMALVSSCASAPVKVGDPAPRLPDDSAESSYQKTVKGYTREQEVYKLFDTRMFVAVTYESWNFREARTRRLGAFQVWPEKLLSEKLASEKTAFDTQTEFFMGVHMNDKNHEDFDKKGSIWRIALVTPSGEVTPTKIERVGRSTMDMRAIYPYMYDFWIGYRLTFPKVELGEKATLRIASTVGQAELTFPTQ